MKSSKIFNEPAKWMNLFRVRSIWAFGLGCGIFMAFNNMTMSQYFYLFPILPIGLFLLSEHLFRGRYTGENGEKLKLKIDRMMGQRPSSFKGSSLEGAELKMGYDKNSLYDRFGRRVCGFELDSGDVKDLEEFFQGSIATAIEVVPEGSAVKDVFVSKKYSSDYIEKYRPALAKAGLTIQTKYLFVIFPPKVDPRDEELTLERLNKHRRLTREEISQYQNLVTQWKSDQKESETPFMDFSARSNGKYMKVYAGDHVYGAMSLAALPQETETDYAKFFEPLVKSESIISTTYVKNSWGKEKLGRMLRVGAALLRNDKKPGETKENSVADKILVDQMQEAEAESDEASLSMFQTAVVYGPGDDVHKSLVDAQNLRISERNIADRFKPVFVQEEGYIDRCLEACCPGSTTSLKEKVQEVIRASEARRYVPIAKRVELKETPLVLRGMGNVPRYIDHKKGGGGVFMLYIGDTGRGKSALISETIRSHMRVQLLEGIKTGVIAGDLGGSHSYIKDFKNTLSLDLADKEEGEYKPFAINPVAAFIGGHDTTDARKMLQNFIMKTMKIGEDPIADNIIGDAIKMMVDKQMSHRMITLHDLIEKGAQDFINGASSHEGDYRIWQERLLTLGKYCEGGVYGHLFDPENAEIISLEQVENFYFNYNLSDKPLKDLMNVFLDLSMMIGYRLCHQYEAGSGRERTMMFVVEEFNEMVKFIGHETFFELKDQARKFGFVPAVAIQSITYLLLEDLSKDRKEDMLGGIGHTFFYGIKGRSGLRAAATLVGEEFSESESGKMIVGPKVRKIMQITKDINEKTYKGYTVGYISRDGDVEMLFVDLEMDFLWSITTDAGGKQIRNKVMERFSITSKEEAGRLLELAGFTQIPKDYVSDDKLNEIIERIELARAA